MGLFIAEIFRGVRQSAVQFGQKYMACLENKACNSAWQTAHCLAGFLFPWVGAGFGGLYAAKYAGSSHQVLACVLSFAVISSVLGDICWVIPKEFWFDLREEHATVGGGLDDALHYWIASAVSWGIILAAIFALGVS